MSNALMMAIIGTLHPVPAAATGIVPVGSATFSGTSNTGSSSTDGSAPCDLPAGCMVGDTAVLTCNALVSRNFTWVAPDGAAVVLAATTYGTLRSAVYAVKLVQADIDAGTVSAPFTALAGSSVPSTVEADVYRAIDSAPIDVVGSTVTGTFPNTHASETVTLPGITTHDAGELVQYAIFTNQPNGYISSTPPAGWTPGASQSAVNGEPALTGYTVQATAGPTGDIAVAVASNLSTMSGAYVGMLFALRAYNPAFRLFGTLPSGTVGTAWTGTLAFAGDYTGTITIDASTGTIPAWMGTPTIDTTAKTVTWSGTPTTAKTESFTPRATASGGQVAVGAAQSVVIAASAVLPSILQKKGAGTNSASPSVTLDAAPTPGNYLVFTLYAASTASVIPAGFTEFTDAKFSAGGRYQSVYYRKVVAGDSATQSMTLSSATFWSAVMFEVKDVASGLSSGVGASVGTATSSTVTIPAGASGALPVVMNGASNIAFSPAWNTPSGFSPVLQAGYSNQVALAVFTGDTASTGAAISASPVGYTTGSHSLQLNGGFLIK